MRIHRQLKLFLATTAVGLAMLQLLNAEPGELMPGWPVSTDGLVFGAPAIGQNGEIVVGTRIPISDLLGDGSVYSFNPDGSIRWKFTGGGDFFESSPTIGQDGTVYIGCWDNKLYALDGNDGTELWHFETDGLIIASPCIGPDGTIYVGSDDGYLYALNPDGSEKWAYASALGLQSEVLDLSPINGSPVLNSSGSRVYFGNEGSEWDAGNLYAVNTATGTRDWVYMVQDTPWGGGINSAPSIGPDGTIYFCSENGVLYALAEDGQLKWKAYAAESMRSSPIVDASGNVYAVSQDGYLYAYSSSGSLLWEVFIGDVFYCTPALDGHGNIIVAAYSGFVESEPWSSLVSIDPNGLPIWQFDFPGYNDSSPNVAPDCSIYFGANNGNLYRLEGNSSLARSGWPRHQGNRRQTGLLEDLYEVSMIDTFPAIASSENGWSHVPWFGPGWLSAVEVPWILHEEHGYLYVQPAGSEAIWYWDTSLEEWCYASSDQMDFIYRAQQDAWLYFSHIYTDEAGRWFYDFSAPVWLQVPYL